MNGERYIDISFCANTVNTSFSYAFFRLLNKNYVVFNFQKLLGFDDVVTHFLPEFSQFPNVGV